MEEIEDSIRESAKDAGIALHRFESLVTSGKENSLAPHPPKYEDLGIVCYTSGTTGNPKGVMITHGNYCGTVAGLLLWAKPLQLTHEETHICYLPLAHVFEQAVLFVILALGGKVGFYQGRCETSPRRTAMRPCWNMRRKIDLG